MREYHFVTSDILISKTPENRLFSSDVEVQRKNENDFS